jgi:ribosomal protein L11 methyltransferase
MMMTDLEQRIINIVTESERKTTFSFLYKSLRSNGFADRHSLKRSIGALVESGKLRYTTRFGESFIEIAYDRPQIVSDRIALLPDHCSPAGFEEYHTVKLETGISFGGGDHPTTRLAIQMIDRFLNAPSVVKEKRHYRVLDIGTGSGVLAITAAKLGAGNLIGIDVDPCAIAEARRNARINGLNTCLRITDAPLSSLTQRFHLITANLRTPTLMVMGEKIAALAQDQGSVILSGMKAEEIDLVSSKYAEMGFSLIDCRSQMGWSVLCLSRGPILNDGV